MRRGPHSRLELLNVWETPSYYLNAICDIALDRFELSTAMTNYQHYICMAPGRGLARGSCISSWYYSTPRMLELPALTVDKHPNYVERISNPPRTYNHGLLRKTLCQWMRSPPLT
jgi:hypothetical protein